MNPRDLVSKQRNFFNTGATHSLSFRLDQLNRLKTVLKEHENDILLALKQDLNKHRNEAYASEIALIFDDLDLTIKNLTSWAEPQSVHTPLVFWPGKSHIYSEPYGVTLIISPWNFPFLLTFQPLIGAIAAGNCVMIKPSEISTHSEQIIAKIINENFQENFLKVVHADAQGSQTLLKEQFDYIFFTGSEHVGKIVMRAAAEYLTPTTLELGGKNPCIVDKTADIKLAAKHIIWGKTLNAGQVCLAPDFLYVHRDVKDALITEMRRVLIEFYGDNPKTSDSYGRIINSNHVKRLKKLLENGSKILGGEVDELEKYVAPTLIDNVTWNDPIMKEEIFGPLLPIFTYDHIDEVITQLKTLPKSLALYLFTKNSALEETIIHSISFGNGAINTCVLQIANPNLPFGGVGASGMGQYHGKFSFETFSHRKSIYKKEPIIDITPNHPPHTAQKEWWIRKLI